MAGAPFVLGLWWFASATAQPAFDLSWLPSSSDLYANHLIGLLEVALVCCGLWVGWAALRSVRDSDSSLSLSTDLATSPVVHAALLGSAAVAMAAWFVRFRLRVWRGALDPSDVGEELVRLLSSTTPSGLPVAAFVTLGGVLGLCVAALLPLKNAPWWSVWTPYRIAATGGGFAAVGAAFTLCTGGL